MKAFVAYPVLRRFEGRMRARAGAAVDLEFGTLAACADPSRRFDEVVALVGPCLEAAWLDRFPALRLVHASGTGVEKIALEALRQEVRVCHTFGHDESIAEFVLMCMLALQRRLLPTDRAMRGGRWENPQWDEALPLPEIGVGKLVTILGTGAIGRATARLCRALGMRCVGVNRTGRPPADGEDFEAVMSVADWREARQPADFLVVAVPLTDATRGLVGEPELARLGRGGFVINVARGPVVEEESLFQALRDGRIAGAALDVWYAYPDPKVREGAPSRFPFHQLPNVIMTPHVSGTTQATFLHRADHIADNLRAFAEGGRLRNEIVRSRTTAE